MAMENQPVKNKIHALIPGGAHTYSKGEDQFPANTPFSDRPGQRLPGMGSGRQRIY